MTNTGPEGGAPAAAPAAGGAAEATKRSPEASSGSLGLAGAGGGERREELSYEEAQRELEQIVQRLESGQAGVEEAIALAERGEQLYRLCAAKLAAAEGKVEELSRPPAAG